MRCVDMELGKKDVAICEMESWEGGRIIYLNHLTGPPIALGRNNRSPHGTVSSALTL